MKAAAIVLTGMVVGALSMGATSTTTPTLTGRIAQLHGETGSVTWQAVGPDAGDIAIGSGSVLPAGMTATANGQTITFTLDAQTVGMHQATLVLELYRAPNINGWAGPQLRISHPVTIEWHVIANDASPFLNGLGDTLATPTP